MDFDTNDPILGFGLITADYETSYYDLVQMMFYDTDVPENNVVRGIRVPLALLVDEFRSCETESMNATEYVIRKMSRTLSEQLDEMAPNPASEELRHLLLVIKEDCWYDADEYEEEGDEEEDEE